MNNSTKHLPRRTPVAIALAALIAMTTVQTTKAASPEVIQIKAKCYQYSPSEIHLKKGVPVVLQITTLDKAHGFFVPDLNIDTTVKPGQTAQVSVTPTKAGVFPFSCDVFCGTGHDSMEGKLIVSDN